MNKDLNTLFNPKSIAVVGASKDTSKIGNIIIQNLIDSQFKGKIYPVNPKYKNILGFDCYPSLADIKTKVDTVVIAIPAPFVKDVMIQAGIANISTAVIISAGFSEIGNDGIKLQEEVLTIAREYEISILGPNCLGIASNRSNMNATFASNMPLKGNISILSQSGAINTAILDMSLQRKLGFLDFISIGNKADITENDLIEYLIKDKDVKAIGAYLESFFDGYDLIKTVENNEKKPIVILHSGETEMGALASSSHTGSIATGKDFIETALKQSGIIKVDSIESLFNTLLMFERTNIEDLKNSKCAIVTNAGGPAIMITDMLDKNNIKLAKLDYKTQGRLLKVLPPASSVKNPVDLLGDANSQRYKDVISILENNNDVGIILTILTPQYMTDIKNTALVLSDLIKNSKKLIIPLFLGGKRISEGLEIFYERNQLAFQYSEDAIVALKNYIDFFKQKPKPAMLTTKIPQNSNSIKDFITNESTALNEELAKSIASELNIPLPKECLTNSSDIAVKFAKVTGFPLVAKATTQDVVHKTDDKMIYLNINSESDLTKSFNQLWNDIKKLGVNNDPKILVQEQIEGGVELFIGIKRDGDKDVYKVNGKGFGHLVIFGHGGIYTETYKDFSKKLVPFTRNEAKEMILETNISEVLKGARGGEVIELEPIIEIIMKLQNLVTLYPEIESLDINPLIVTRDQALCADVKIFVKK